MTPRSTSPNLPQPPQPAPASVTQSPRRSATAAPPGTTAPRAASSRPPPRATGRAVAAFQVHRPVETGRLPGAFAGDGEDVGFRVPAIADLGQLARERLDPCFELHREPAFQTPRRAGNIGRTLRRS